MTVWGRAKGLHMDERNLAGAPVYDQGGVEIGRVTDVAGDASRSDAEGIWIAIDGVGQPVHVSRDVIRQATPERLTLNISRQMVLAGAESVTVPLHEEVLEATTREVEQGHVRVRKRVETVPFEQTVSVSRDDVSIEHVPVDQIVERAPEPRWDGDTLIVPLVEEVVYVEKRLRVREELRITRHRVDDQRTIRDDLRHEVADVETSGDIDVTGSA